VHLPIRTIHEVGIEIVHSVHPYLAAAGEATSALAQPSPKLSMGLMPVLPGNSVDADRGAAELSFNQLISFPVGLTSAFVPAQLPRSDIAQRSGSEQMRGRMSSDGAALKGANHLAEPFVIRIRLAGNGFLKQMVRRIVGMYSECVGFCARAHVCVSVCVCECVWFKRPAPVFSC